MLSKSLLVSSLTFSISILVFTSCYNSDLPEPVCANSDLTVNAFGTDPLDCASKGSIDVTAAGGKAPYLFALDNGDFSESTSFTDVVSGSHLAFVKDKNGCISFQAVELQNPGSTLAIDAVDTVSSGCNSSNGIITLTASGGAGTLSYSMDNIDYSNTTGVFDGLPVSIYSIFVKDDNGCVMSENNVRIASGVSYKHTIKPILEANCIKSGCHNGDNGSTRNWMFIENVQAKAQRIKQYTGDGTMPLDIAPTGLPQFERDLIACWVDDGAPNN